MAATLRHAAGQQYEVHELLDGDPPVDLGLRFQASEFGTAVEFAFEYLERRDPQREGIVSALEIVRVSDSEPETVWGYSHAQAARSPNDLVRRWGYDVTRPWSSPYRLPLRSSPAR
jgi:hypothetical protein